MPVMGKRLFLPLFGLILTLLMLGPARSTAQDAPDPRFGMTEAFWLPEEARDLGVGWERILFYWREIQPLGPDDWNTLHVLEEWLVEAESQGREVVGLIKNTAPWASVDGSEAGLPKGLNLAVDDPDNLWANYVGRLADYYGPRGVHHWIIWNEPEIAQGVYGFEFAGTAADYYQLLKTSYKVMKQRDPEAVIHLAGLTWWHDPTFLDRLLAIAAADPEADANGYFFDVISLHIYFRTETIKSIVEEVAAIQGRYGLEKPIWINEMNAPPNRDPEWPVERPRFNVDLDQQAWFIIQAVALGFASGAERIGVYKLLDIHLPPGGESFGLVRPDQSHRPAYNAYKMTTRCFGAFEDIAMQEDPLFYQITFSRPGSLTHVAWSRTQSAAVVQIDASTENAAVIAPSGARSEVVSEQGVYELHLSGQRCDQECLVGGEPLVLVETTGEDRYAQSCLDFRVARTSPATSPTATSAPSAYLVEEHPGAEPEMASQAPLENVGVPGDRQVATPGPTATTATSGERRPVEGAATGMGDSVADAATRAPGPATLNGGTGNDAALTGAGEKEAGGEIGRAPIGLAFLGLGALLALILALLTYRTRIDRKA